MVPVVSTIPTVLAISSVSRSIVETNILGEAVADILVVHVLLIAHRFIPTVFVIVLTCAARALVRLLRGRGTRPAVIAEVLVGRWYHQVGVAQASVAVLLGFLALTFIFTFLVQRRLGRRPDFVVNKELV